MKLALNMIVGPNEAFELNRCLEGVCIPGFFDEVVIVTTSNDESVEEVAKKYTDKVFKFKWIKDFAAARNYAIDNTNSSHIMWLDADDIIDELSRSRLLRMKEFIGDTHHDMFMVPYKLDPNENGFQQVIPRERVFKNNGIRWIKKVHEQLPTKNVKLASFNGISVEHHSMKSGQESLLRNVEILEREYKKNPNDEHYAFYLARDLSVLKKYDRSIPIFKDIINRQSGNIGNLYISSFEIALYYIYNDDNSLKSSTINKGETYARIALSFSDLHAEPYVLLGDIYHYRGKTDKAVKFYKLAMGKRLNGKTLQQLPYYEQIPSMRLSRIYEESDAFEGLEQALYYNKLALKHSNEKNLITDRQRIIGKILNS